MKKRGILFTILFISLLIINLQFLLSQSNSSNTQSPSLQNTDFVNKAYQCLQNQIESKSQSEISLQEATFATLALGSNSKLSAVIEENKINNNHWSESPNDIKDTAQALLAYKRSAKESNQIESWLNSKLIPAKDLIWYLQIDIPNRIQSSCELNYQNEQRTVNVNEDLTLSGNPGSCFTISQSNFWLRLNNNCAETNFTISCDNDFITSLLYQRNGASTIFISPATHSASALGTTKETINSKCLGSSNTCDYEGTLWASLALDTAGKDVSFLLPYLSALSESNLKYLPSAFLYKITSGDDQYSVIVQSQQQEKYWQAPNTPYNRYYDSSLAILSLQETSSTELSSSKDYFSEIVTEQGCWNDNNIRDTGFLLYAGWPRTASSGSGSSSGQTCSSQGYSCTTLFSCNDLQGEVLNYNCNSGICCSKSLVLESCSSQEGTICSSSQECSGTTSNSAEGSCCLGTCQALPQASACELKGGSCYSSCEDNEIQISDACENSGEVCCTLKTSSSTSSSAWIWIIILIILIGLIGLGIYYRNKLRLLIFKFRNRKNSSNSPVTQQRPSFPPRGPPRQGYPPHYPQRPQNQNKEMDETLRKLKEMSK